MSLLWPAYLLGFLGLGLPWLLHRFSNQQPPEQPFPSTRFLEATKPPVSRRKKLRHLLLLALRILLLAGLCLLFAEPWLRTDATGTASERLHLIAIDRSLSMRTGERWEKAISHARDSINAVPEGDSLQLLSFDRNLEFVTDVLVSKADALSVLASIKPGYSRADYGDVMQRLNTTASDSSKPVVATIISDAQVASLPVQLNMLVAAQIDTLAVLDVSSPGEQNVHLSAQALTSDNVHARIAITVMASSVAINSSDGGVSNSANSIEREVVVRHQGRVLAQETLNLTPGDVRTLVLEQIPLPASNDTDLQVSIDGEDDLAEDHTVDVVVRGASPINVAIASLVGTDVDQASVFVKTALETNGEAQVIEAPGGQSSIPTDALHAVVFVDLEQAGDVPPEVQRFVDKGGNALLINRSSTLSTLNNPITATSRDALNTGRVDDAHPLALGDIDWLGVRFYELPDLGRLVRETDRTLLETTSRLPILIERNGKVGSGSMLILSDGLNGEISDLPLQPAFVSLMQNVLTYFHAQSALPNRIFAGSHLTLPANVQVLSPSGDALLELSETSTPLDLQLTEPGLYSIVGTQGLHRLAVVIDPVESDVRTLPAEELRAWEKKQGGSNTALDSNPETTENSVSEVTEAELSAPELASESTLANINQLALWRYLLPLAVLFMFMESMLANRRLNIRRDGS